MAVQLKIEDTDPAELASRMMYTMDRDFAVAYLVKPENRDKWTDDELVALTRVYAAMPKPEPTYCHECGQSLPTEA